MSADTQNHRRGSLEEEAELLPQDPPPLITRGIGWLLIVIFFTALAAAIFVQVPETVRCPFVLTPRDGADPIQTPCAATIEEVRIVEGQEVAAGVPLFVLRSDEIRQRHTLLQTLTEELRTKEEGIVKIEESYAAQLSIKNAEIAQVERELKFRGNHAQTSRDLVGRLTKLSQSGGVSEIELAKYQLALAESEKDLNISEKTLDGVKLERQKMETERARQRAEEQTAVHSYKVRIAALRRDLENSQHDLLEILAPYNAVVLALTQRNVRNVVQPGQELCQLARLDATPRARLLLKESGLSRLAPGQRVRLFFDAFPYQRYGTITAMLEWISPAAVTSPEGPGFIARAPLDRTSILVNGEPRPLRVGMKGEARIVVGSRAVIEYAFEPVRKLRENMRQ